jgi:hypothetical protein
MNYTPDDIDRLYSEAVAHISSMDLTDLKEGGRILKEIIGLFKTLGVSQNMLCEFLEAIEYDVAEIKNPWFASERMKIALEEAQLTKIFLGGH